MNTRTIISAAITLAAALSGTAQAASDDAAFDASLQHYRGQAAQGVWHNPLMPQGTGALVQPSGDTVLQTIVAAYDRTALDRGGWSNTWVTADHYAVGEPLLAVKVGEGLTTRTAAAATPAIHRSFASR
jgi:hypothetical protein